MISKEPEYVLDKLELVDFGGLFSSLSVFGSIHLLAWICMVCSCNVVCMTNTNVGIKEIRNCLCSITS